MQAEENSRCPHFQLRSHLLDKEARKEGREGFLMLQHCLLTARMRRLLLDVPEAKPLIARLSIRVDEDQEYMIVGPDLDTVIQATCHVSRCDGFCTPAYLHNLEQFNIRDPHADTVTCDEKRDDVADPVDRKSASVPPCAC